jgi:hypothetical protein
MQVKALKYSSNCEGQFPGQSFKGKQHLFYWQNFTTKQIKKLKIM